MHRNFALFSMVLLAPTILAAQAPASGYGVAGMEGLTGRQNPTVSVVVVPAPDTCPVVMNARHEAGFDLVRVGPGSPQTQTAGQRLRLTLARPGSAITAATVVVHGFSGRPVYVPLDSSSRTAADASRSIAVSFPAGSSNQAAASLNAPGFTAVTRIDLKSITYADGTTWKSDGRLCSVVPNPFMLVSAR